MLICIDRSSTQIWRLKRKHPEVGFMQLRTPLTQFARDGLELIHYGLDNGAYTGFDAATFTRMALKAKDDPLCDWIVMPDLVGDAGSTTALFYHWISELQLEDKRAYALQDGATPDMIPWGLIEAVFVGGSDHFKESRICREIAQQARDLGIWVHVGRVNTPRRIVYWDGVANSFDGSGIARFDVRLGECISTIKQLQGSTQFTLDECL